MIRSMTAFANSRLVSGSFSLVWEIRSVNHRYLEINQKLPESLRELEMPVRERCRAILERGKVDIYLRYQPANETAQLSLNRERVQQLADLTRETGDIILHAGAVSLTDILQFPGVLTSTEPDMEPVKTQAMALFDQALEQLIANREREGAELKRFMETRLEQVSAQVEEVRQLLTGLIEQQRDKIRTQAQELASINPERLEQALVDLLQRMDVEEELSRLDAHIKEARFQLDQPATSDSQGKKSLGRRLDFLMQEFNREANTLGSKSSALETTSAAVELKVLIEQMREQVQNIE
jgi:uncharacterized protein (TIGR00255 family)